MPAEPQSQPIEDSVPRYEDVAVGEDLGFQRKWWVFERIIWTLFLLLVIADLLGALGRGWLAKAQRIDPAQGLRVNYERVERAGTPSTLTLHVDPVAVSNSEVNIFVSQEVTRDLGAQRISPEPFRSRLVAGGICYTFPVVNAPATIEFQLQPSFIGVHPFQVSVSGFPGKPIEGKVLVLP